ncbi:MAG: asparagine synthase (glutamine-hydrolyzing) [Verrucomicrobiota bacterium]
MCGIAGLIDPNGSTDDALLERMSAPLVKRGPDEGGMLRQNGCALLHRRLSIIDVEGGHQPIVNEDGTLALVCNGEIYDFCELRNRLESKGHSFRTRSDSEVILHLYEDLGPDCVCQLNGMFAFAILHLKERRLFCARDRFGQKPLFYAVDGAKFAFASGPASLAAVPWVDTNLNAAALREFLVYQAIPGPESVYCGVRKLPPQSRALWRDGELHIEPYGVASLTADFAGSYEEARTELTERLGAAVERRLIADVPVGMFLSGGVDSSVICALAAERSAGQIRTFSIGFPEPKYDERKHAERVAKHLGTDHHFREVCADDFAFLERIAADFEEPFGDASMLPAALLAEFTRGQVKVALSGDGADELFGGYDRYRVMHWARLSTVVPAALRRGVRKLLLAALPPKTEERTALGRLRRLVEISDREGVEQYLAVISRFPERLSDRLLGPRLREPELSGQPDIPERALQKQYREHPALVDAIMELDIRTYLPNDILVKVDRTSMAQALEVRSPFLDPNVADLALALPHAWKIRGGRGKRILTDAFGGYLPPGIVGRSKMGFGVPLAQWFRNQWRDLARDALFDGECIRQELVRSEGLQQLFDDHEQNRADHSYTLFMLLILELWLRQR